MKLRRIATAAVAAALTASTLTTPAQADTLEAIDETVDEMNCGHIIDRIRFLDLYEDDHAASETTRNELAQNIRELSQPELGIFFSGAFPLFVLGLRQAQIVDETADKALECGFVAEDPALPIGSSQIFDNLPMLEALSSELN